MAEAVLGVLEVAADTGLSANEVARRQSQFGANALEAIHQRNVWSLLVAQFRSIIVLLLAGATLVSALFGEWVEALEAV